MIVPFPGIPWTSNTPPRNAIRSRMPMSPKELGSSIRVWVIPMPGWISSPIHAQKAVIANVNPHALVDGLIDPVQLPGPYVKRFRKYRFGPGTMMIHLALSGPVLHVPPHSRMVKI